MSEKNEVVAYHPNWLNLFEDEASLIKENLKENFLEIHHVGSTAIPGLEAKPPIEILLVVKDLTLACESLEKINFVFQTKYAFPVHFYFKKKENMPFDLHVYSQRHPEIELNLCFTNYLKHHPEVVEAYSPIDKEALKDESAFQEGKSGLTPAMVRKRDFVQNTLEKAGFNQLYILPATTEKEWEAVKAFRHKYVFSVQGLEDPNTWSFDHPDHAHILLYDCAKIVGYAHLQFNKHGGYSTVIVAMEENSPYAYQATVFFKLIEQWIEG